MLRLGGFYMVYEEDGRVRKAVVSGQVVGVVALRGAMGPGGRA